MVDKSINISGLLLENTRRVFGLYCLADWVNSPCMAERIERARVYERKAVGAGGHSDSCREDETKTNCVTS